MIADTTFCSDLIKERRHGIEGPASKFIARHRAQKIRLSIITAGEISVLFNNSTQAWNWLEHWTIFRLSNGVVDIASDIDRKLMTEGKRLGENDNWIAGFAMYYREPLISRDKVFDRVKGLRRLGYDLENPAGQNPA